MSDETTVQLGHQELQDHNELVEYIRKLLEKIKLLTDLYDQNLTALTEHNESESSHPDLRILLAEGNDELQNQLDSFKDDIIKKTDATDKRITDGLNDLDMIEYAGCGVAVKNAHPSLKKAADFVAPWTNNEDAVARTIEKLLLDS